MHTYRSCIVNVTISCLLAVTYSIFPVNKQVWAYESRIVSAPSGKQMFELRFYDLGEGFGVADDYGNPNISTWQLEAEHKDAVSRAAMLWAETLACGRNNFAIPIDVGTYGTDESPIMNADAVSFPSENANGEAGYTGMAEGIILGQVPEEATQIRLGQLDFAVADRLSQIPAIERIDVVGVLYHEIGHALGITSYASPDGITTLSKFDEHLVDRTGKRLAPGIDIAKDGTVDSSSTDFVVGERVDSGVTFHGTNTHEVMGSYAGITIEGYEKDTFDLSHLELERSLMSHQSYRNYTTFMEAEIAVLQDIGYDIDRRNFFGSSVYGNGLTIDNQNGYFARNADGTDYRPGLPNATTLGVGLHIYGKNNTINQYADLLAGGTAGTGIRVDGSHNRLTIPAQTRVAADGQWGTGLLVSYGKEHVIDSAGEITALGPDGVAVRFDFGHSLLGDAFEYRGSYIWTLREKNHDISGGKDQNGFALNLDGPLVSKFNVSGKLAGTEASIHISENAFVQNINFLPGADVTGDIISEYDPNNTLIQYTGDKAALRTSLDFGMLDSAMVLQGDIFGASSFDMIVSSGQVDLYGSAQVYSLNNDAHLALLKLNGSEPTVTITDTFTSSKNATLETVFNAEGQVAGIEVGRSLLSTGGTWALTPLADFYSDTAGIDLEVAIQDPTGQAAHTFDNIKIGRNMSPTLLFGISQNDPVRPIVRVTRPASAYSQYAANDTDASLGCALVNVARQAYGRQDDMHALFTALDFSDIDGSGVRRGLTQLGAESYDVAARASLRQQQNFNSLLLRRMLTGESLRRIAAHRQKSAAMDGRTGFSAEDAADADQTRPVWQAWLTPFANSTTQTSYGSTAGSHSTGMGLLGGMECRLSQMDGQDTGLTLGWHLALAGTRTGIDGLHDARADTFGIYLGGQALYSPDDWHGFHLFGQGRVGMEDSRMQRSIDINDYHRQNRSQWTGLLASASFGGGRDWTWDNIVIGPLLWFEYAVLRRPGVEESGGGATCLKLDDKIYQSLPVALGGHMGTSFELNDNLNLQADMLAAWRHELLDGEFRSNSAFRGYESTTFSSQTRLVGRDSLLVQGSLRLAHVDNLFTQLDVGGEFRTASTAMNLGLSFGWQF